MTTLTPTQKRKQMRALLCAQQAVQAPGIYDGDGARLVQQAGFSACYMTGNGVSATLLGRPDVGLVDLTMIADHARRVASCIDIPLICDADTGYGNVVNVRRTIAEFEAAGVVLCGLKLGLFEEVGKLCEVLSGCVEEGSTLVYM